MALLKGLNMAISGKESEMQSTWINVKDKLPKEYERVLIWAEGHGMLIDSYGPNGFERLKTFRYAWAWGYHKNVTHWMPLPSMPLPTWPDREGK